MFHRSYSACRLRPLSAGVLVVAQLIGCSSNSPPPDQAAKAKPRESGPVRVMVVDAPELGRVIERRWRANFDSEIEMRHTGADFLRGTDLKMLDADVIIYPAGLIGELVQRDLIMPVSKDALADEEYQISDLFSMERAGVTWGQQDYAFTFGSPQLTLMYRADVFRQLGVSPPKTWSQYEQLAALLDQREKLGSLAPPADASWAGTAEPRGAGWSGQVLLARAAPYVRHRARYSSVFSISSMDPLIAAEPFVKALNELVAADRHNLFAAGAASPVDTYQALIAGRCAMAIGWPCGVASSDLSDATGAAGGEIRFAELPGASQVFSFTRSAWEPRRAGEERHIPLLNVDGRLGSVTRQSPRRRLSHQFLIWLTSAKNSPDISPQSWHTTLFRTSHLSNSASWLGSEVDAASAGNYADLLERISDRQVWMYSPRLPGRDEYLSALDAAVKAAAAGTAAAEALQRAADKWREITNRRGVDEQRRAYERSLGVGV